MMEDNQASQLIHWHLDEEENQHKSYLSVTVAFLHFIFFSFHNSCIRNKRIQCNIIGGFGRYEPSI